MTLPRSGDTCRAPGVIDVTRRACIELSAPATVDRHHAGRRDGWRDGRAFCGAPVPSHRGPLSGGVVVNGKLRLGIPIED